jgi:integrase/recombinase XerD
VLSKKKRGGTWRVEGAVNKRYFRLSLGTRASDAATKYVNEIELALIDGTESARWVELRRVLPENTFRFFAGIVGWKDKPAPAEVAATWADLVREFSAQFQRKILQGDRSDATWRRYKLSCETFAEFLVERGISKLADISRRVVEEFKAHRLEATLKRKNSRGGSGLHLDIAILHAVFAFGIDVELLVGKNNPVKFEKYPGKKPKGGAQPFTYEELARLRQAAGQDLLPLLFLRHTGLRGFDATDTRWSEIDLRDRMLCRVTHKRQKQVWIPLHPELLFALESACAERRPQPSDHVLLNPETGGSMSRPRLYERIKALGERASVNRTHPHRFRDTLAVDMLLKGASPYDVAKTLGDTIAVVEEHYAPYVKELRERTRRIIESPDGIEKPAPDCTVFAHRPEIKGKVQ